ncbi:alpha/beta hydrolase [Levilactobacillus suantsaii]|uniref:alpha/beta hydrolase n=1 Tax=Levilactobacillus suantsaii TaxID=2292255 RepID=UPI0015F3BE5C|nr:alpha/beta hydrolase [Levilactobacillus suantsaii]QMU07640.1 alpha/beta hydrolase [Levilactobacillus suantsaii]
MKKIRKWLLGGLLALLLIIIIGVIVLKQQAYTPSTAATTAAKTSIMVSSTTKFQGNDANPQIIFYPGALVDPKSYSIWAHQVAQAGYSVYIVHFPLDLAVLRVNAANKVRTKQNYVIGGHSLGGTMASRYAHQHQKGLKGVFFLASYPEAKGSLRHTKVPVLSLTATRDGVLNQAHYQQAKRFLPQETKYVQISGGNHAGFGSYGHQKGDHDATITVKKQQRLVAHRLITWLNNRVR